MDVIPKWIAVLSFSMLLVVYSSIGTANADLTPRQSTNNTLPTPSDPFALVISGGISLGVYEAGLNWAIVEALRHENRQTESRNAYRLDTVAGASAGAINSILAAMRFCEADTLNDHSTVGQNLFKETWSVVVDDLLPDDESEYNTIDLHLGLEGKRNVKDSILSRNGFKSIIEKMEQAAGEKRYREGCKVNLALMVTHTQPQSLEIPTSSQNQTLKVQRFVVPLTVAAVKPSTEDQHASMQFENNVAYKDISPKGSAFLFLPETNGRVMFDHVVRAALSSSAFPAAFGRIQMDYCIPPDVRSGTAVVSDACPKSYKMDRGYFSDGGAFDNVPLGVAVDLLEACNQPGEKKECKKIAHNQALARGNYIYMDPATRRKVYVKPDNAADDNGGMSVMEQIETILPTLSTLQAQELNSAIADKFYANESNQHRTLLLTSRFAPITGNFLGHFGAFFDETFQTYDYAVGVYDGVMNVADYQCRALGLDGAELSHCQDKRFVKLAKVLLTIPSKSITTKEAACSGAVLICQLIGAFYEWEHGAQAEGGIFDSLKIKSPEYAILQAMKAVGDSDFELFLDELSQSASLFKGKQLSYMIDNRNGFWKIDLLGRFSRRLVEMEEDSDGGFVAPLKLMTVMANSRKRSRKNSIWSMSSVPDKPWWYRAVPDQISMDGAQTGAALSWMGVPQKLAFSRWHIELDGTAHFQLKDVDSHRTHYGSFGAALRYSVSSVLGSSIGFGLNVNRNMTNTDDFGNRYLTGGELTFGFLADKTRITIGTRDLLHDYVGEDWSVRIGITDLDSVLYVMGL